MWIGLALVSSFLQTLYGYINSHFKLPGVVLNIYRGAVPVLLLLPALPFFPLPHAWQFYALTAFNGFLVAYADARFFDATARFGNAPILRLKPLVLIMVFFLWLPLDMAHTERLFQHRALTAGILGTLLITSVSLFFMARSKITTEALRFVLPALLAGAAIDTVNKLTTRYSHGFTGAVSYAIFVSLFVFLFLLPRIGMKKIEPRVVIQPQAAIAGIGIGLTSVGFNLAKNLAMAQTPNPAFVTALIFCSGVWATIAARLFGRHDDHNILAGLVFVVSAVMLIVLGSYL